MFQVPRPNSDKKENRDYTLVTKPDLPVLMIVGNCVKISFPTFLTFAMMSKSGLLALPVAAPVTAGDGRSTGGETHCETD